MATEEEMRGRIVRAIDELVGLMTDYAAILRPATDAWDMGPDVQAVLWLKPDVLYECRECGMPGPACGPNTWDHGKSDCSLSGGKLGRAFVVSADPRALKRDEFGVVVGSLDDSRTVWSWLTRCHTDGHGGFTVAEIATATALSHDRVVAALSGLEAMWRAESRSSSDATWWRPTGGPSVETVPDAGAALLAALAAGGARAAVAAGPFLCDHANECQRVCKCDAQCYCKGRTCAAGSK